MSDGVSIPRDVLAKLYAVYDAWENKVDCYDPGDGPEMKGMASLIGVEGSWAMEQATTAFEPHAATVRQLIDDEKETHGAPQ
jgi:hypothetical protein